jgi:hypothetical protein
MGIKSFDISKTLLRLIFIGTIPEIRRSQWPRGLGVDLRPLACYYRGSESHRGHGCSSVVCVVR